MIPCTRSSLIRQHSFWQLLRFYFLTTGDTAPPTTARIWIWGGGSFRHRISYGNRLPFQTTYAGGEGGSFACDVSISKFTADGTDLVYSTFLGGSRMSCHTAWQWTAAVSLSFTAQQVLTIFPWVKMRMTIVLVVAIMQLLPMVPVFRRYRYLPDQIHCRWH